jgi:S1/P1 Nuclease
VSVYQGKHCICFAPQNHQLYILILPAFTKMLRSRSGTLLAVIYFTSLISSSLCWGALGHRTVAYLAAQYFTPNTTTYVNTLLNSQDISEAALWPDKVRHMPIFSYTAGWHYIDAQDDPPHQCGVNIKRDCDRKAGCIVSAIVNQTARIMRPESSRADKGQALRFLLHFFGDIHQPLHTEAEGRGGNDIEVLFGKKHTNLHSIWDTDMLVKHAGPGNDEKAIALAWAKELYAADKDHAGSLAAECQDLSKAENCSFSYADEANQWVCDYVLKDDVAGVEGKDLSREYYDGAVPIIELLIGKAGRRLAAWVNALAANASESSSDNLDGGEAIFRAQDKL